MITSIKSWLTDPLGKKRLQRRVALLEELLEEEREAHRRDIRYEWSKAEQQFELRTQQLQAEIKALRETIINFHNVHTKTIYVQTETAPLT